MGLPALMTIEEVADYFKVTPKAILKQRAEGRAPGSLGIRRGKRLLWRSADLERFIGGQIDDSGAETLSYEAALLVALGGIEKAIRANTRAIRETARRSHPGASEVKAMAEWIGLKYREGTDE